MSIENEKRLRSGGGEGKGQEEAMFYLCATAAIPSHGNLLTVC